MRKFLQKYSEPIIISLLSFIVIFVNIFPFLYRLYNASPDRGFAGYQFYTVDYNVYLGHFKEGAEGVWLVHDKHTSEPQEGFILRREYIIWGYIAGFILHLPIVFVYHSARIFGGFLLLFSIYLLIKEVFPDNSEKALISGKIKRILAFILSTLIAGFPKYTIDPKTGKQNVDLFFYWFTENDAAERFATLFHYLLGNSILLLFLVLFIKFKKSQKSLSDSKFIILNSILLCWAAALIHPSTFATIFLIFALYIIIKIVLNIIKYIFIDKKVDYSIIRDIIYITIPGLLSIPVVLLLNNEVRRFPWNEIAKWDKMSVAPIDLKEYILSLGPNFFLGILGALIFLFIFLKSYSAKKNNSRFVIQDSCFLLIACFPLATFLLAFKLWPYLLDINRLRFLQVPIFVPLAIFSTIAITEISQQIGKCFNKSGFRISPPASGSSKMTSFFVLSLSLLALVYITFPAYKIGLTREVTMFPKNDGLLYPEKPIMTALDFLDKNTKPSEVVLAAWQASGLIPGFSGNTSYFGHPWSTVNFSEKEKLLTKFFRSEMELDEAKKFLKEGYINYVFYSPQEKSYGGNMEKYKSLLKKVYETPEVTIWKVK